MKDSYLLEKQKQLGEFFSEENWEEDHGADDDEEVTIRHDNGDSSEVQQDVNFDVGCDKDIDNTEEDASEPTVKDSEDPTAFSSGETTVHRRTPVLATS